MKKTPERMEDFSLSYSSVKIGSNERVNTCGSPGLIFSSDMCRMDCHVTILY